MRNTLGSLLIIQINPTSSESKLQSPSSPRDEELDWFAERGRD
jgi:hypothetical protein